MDNHLETLRLIELSYEPGSIQLARTDAIMHAVGSGAVPPTLRLYSWSEPVVILGVGQSIRDLNLNACDRNGYRVLRRSGGGTAVFHDEDELSIDLILPTNHRLAERDVHQGYRMFAEFLAKALGRCGVSVELISIERARSITSDPQLRPICFASVSPYEFLGNGRKLNGLCQVRRRDVIAYQTAIYRRFKREPLVESLTHESPEERMKRSDHLEHEVTDLNDLNNEPFDFRSLQRALVECAEEKFEFSVVSNTLTESESARADELVRERYGNPDWIARR